jgi:CRISPR-associated endonuclease/helicase Cas3
MHEEELLWLWGKTVKDEPARYHPVLFHLLDVGHCAMLLWDEGLPDAYKAELASELGMQESDLRRAVIWLATWHDIGKVAPGFQFVATAPQWLWPRLKGCGLHQSSDWRVHGLVSAHVLMNCLQNGKVGWKVPDSQTALIWAHIAGAHHGTFPHSGETDFGTDVLGDEVWDNARIEIMKATARLLTPDDKTLQSGAWPNKIGGAAGWLAGLISVADWLGSSDHFPAAAHQNKDTLSAEEYSCQSQANARKALTEFGWLPRFTARSTPLNFQQTFKFKPNILQQEMQKCARNLSAPFFAIAEAPMGVGKTEAAFAALDAAFAQGQAHGFYIALPTQATSNAMHDRARDDYLKRCQNGEINLQLAHSGALLKDEDEPEVEVQPGSIDIDENRTEATVAAQSWFTFRKRPLLAPFGVGTIDQSLMGVLQTKHWFVRVFGLAGKVVIFDEVHAYDAYMSTLLERLLNWLRANGCSVILLSATLPSSRRHALLKAWGAASPEDEEAYPRLTWVDDGKPLSISVAEPNVKPKDIALKFAPTNALALAATLREKLEKGGCAAIICNTVKRAQELYKSLKAELGEEFCGKENWHLFHARMPFAWRQERERKILKSFGKDKSQRPQRAIVISTQVMEQSLDLDFDWMASELAPIDLLLQRAGRMHRHENTTRPVALQNPELMILCDGGENGEPPELAVPDDMYSHFILLQTWLALRDKGVLQLPDEIEDLIETVYEKHLPAPDEVWAATLQAAQDRMETAQKKAVNIAEAVSIVPPNDAEAVADFESEELREDDDPETHKTLRAATRSGDPSIQVVCLIEEDGKKFLPNINGRADRNQIIDLNINPSRDLSRALLRAAVPISHKGLFHELQRQELPPGWKKNAYLRYARIFVFKNGCAIIGQHSVFLDHERGIIY